jgi:hypothetical protein
LDVAWCQNCLDIIHWINNIWIAFLRDASYLCSLGLFGYHIIYEIIMQQAIGNKPFRNVTWNCLEMQKISLCQAFDNELFCRICNSELF